MVLYICIIFVLLGALAISVTDCGDNWELKSKRRFVYSRSIYGFLFILLMALFWFLTAFRGDSIGNDTRTYLNYYEEIAKHGINANWHIEIGYQYFCLLLSKISPNPYFLLIVCSTICYTVCGIFIYRYSNTILFSVILLFCIAFPFFASGIRQSIALVFVLWAYAKIKDNKKVIPLILILIASVFHVSALMSLLWFAHKYIPKKPVYVITLALITAVLAASGVLNSFLTGILQEYQGYFDSEYAGTGWLGITYYLLRAVVFYLFIYFVYKEECRQNSLIISNSVLLLFTVCLGFSVNLFNRASLYFLILIVVDLPNAFNSGKLKNRDIWMIVTGIVMLSYFIVTLIIRPEWNNLYPYEFNWS